MQVCSTDQCEAGRDDHHDDERLEVVVFHQHVSVATQFPEDASDHSVIHHAQQRRTLARARLGTTFVRVLDEHHVHLADRQTDRQTDTQPSLYTFITIARQSSTIRRHVCVRQPPPAVSVTQPAFAVAKTSTSLQLSVKKVKAANTRLPSAGFRS